MINWYKFVLLYLWVTPHLLLAGVAFLLWKRRLHLRYVVFFTYACYEIVEFFLLFLVSQRNLNLRLYYAPIYLGTLVISTALRFGIIQEIFNNIFRAQEQSETLAPDSLRWATVFLVTIAILCSLFLSSHTASTFIAGAAWVERGVAIIQCGLVLFLFLFSGLLGLSWDSYAFGMAFGFGVLSSVELANWAMHTQELSVSAAKVLNLLPTGGYHIAVLIWIGYLIVPARRSIQPPDEPIMYDVHHWNNELERFLQ
jgi:hypothetical protein